MLALMRINAIPIPATTLPTSQDLEYRLVSADIKAIITSYEDADKVETAANTPPRIPLSIIIAQCHCGWHNPTLKKEIKQALLREKGLFHQSPWHSSISHQAQQARRKWCFIRRHPTLFAHLITGKYWLGLKPGRYPLESSSDPMRCQRQHKSSLFGLSHMGAAIFSFLQKRKSLILH